LGDGGEVFEEDVSGKPVEGLTIGEDESAQDIIETLSPSEGKVQILGLVSGG